MVGNKIAIDNDETREWLIGKNDYDYCKKHNKPKIIADERRKSFNEVIRTKQTLEWQETLIRNNQEQYLLRKLSPILNIEGNVEFIIGYGIDITKQKETELALSKAIRMAEENVKTKSQFLSTMSHEIRTPLNAVIGISHILIKRDQTEEQMKYLNSLHFSAQNLLNLIRLLRGT